MQSPHSSHDKMPLSKRNVFKQIRMSLVLKHVNLLIECNYNTLPAEREQGDQPAYHIFEVMTGNKCTQFSYKLSGRIFYPTIRNADMS